MRHESHILFCCGKILLCCGVLQKFSRLISPKRLSIEGGMGTNWHFFQFFRSSALLRPLKRKKDTSKSPETIRKLKCAYQSFHVNQTSSTWVNVGGCRLAAYQLTKKGRRGDGPIASGHHNTDPGLDEGYGKVYDLWPLLVDGEWSHRHVGVLQHHLQDNHRETETDSSANVCSTYYPEDGEERNTTVLQFISMLWSFQVFKMLFLEETGGLLLHCVCVQPPPTSFPPSVFRYI